MSEIAMQSRGKRPRFFPESGGDEMVSMLLELVSEVWVIRERLYALEKVAAEAGLELTPAIESWEPTAEQASELDRQRKQLIQTVLRSLEANHAPGRHLRRSLDAADAQQADSVLESVMAA